MANTSQKHKEKRSQKRKDRQLRRKERAESKVASQKTCQFMVDQAKMMKGSSKSLPGFLAKNVSSICKWIEGYCILFQKADDAYISYLKDMSRDDRNQLIQDYVDMRVFLQVVRQLESRGCSTASATDESICESEESNEEAVEKDVG